MFRLMKTVIAKDTEFAMIKLGLYQIAGGIVGIVIIIWGMYKTPLLTGLSTLLFLFIILLFTYSIFCGTICLKTKENALAHSLANQFLQLIGFAIMGFAFKYIAGFYLSIGLNLTESVKFDVGADISTFAFNLNNEVERLEVDLNLIAFGLVFWIDNLMTKVKVETKSRQIASIGEISSTVHCFSFHSGR